ncbi:MAG: hypothetical protein FWG74_09480 [Planctomycetes bacterium]|nr:hypothetical protein [Planctomycetota bacterium]
MSDSIVPIRATFDLGEPPADVQRPTADDTATASGTEAVSSAVSLQASAGIRFCIAIDFDGVLARKAWPAIGEEMPGAMAFLKWVDEQGWWRILWSCRADQTLDAALGWLAKRGFGKDWWTAVNATPKPISDLYGNDSRKPGYHAIVDDLAIGFPVKADGAPDWKLIKAELEERAAAWRAPSGRE